MGMELPQFRSTRHHHPEARTDDQSVVVVNVEVPLEEVRKPALSLSAVASPIVLQTLSNAIGLPAAKNVVNKANRSASCAPATSKSSERAVMMKPKSASVDTCCKNDSAQQSSLDTHNVSKPGTEVKADDSTTSTLSHKTTYVSSSTVVFWLSMWFFQNMAVTFWNKKALNTLRLPVTLTFVHMLCNWLGAYLYINVYKGVERKQLDASQKRLMVYFSWIFVSNIITGNWSLGLVSISFNQVMRALVPGVVVVLSMMVLSKSYSRERKLALIPVAYGVYLACSGDNSATFIGFLMTLLAVVLAALKVVMSSKFLTGDLKLHPVDLIYHQAPLSAFWCLCTMFFTGEMKTLETQLPDVASWGFWFILTGMISFLLNITSFYANKVTSPVTLSVCGNVKQIMVIALSIAINHEALGVQKAVGIAIVTLGGAGYAYISHRELNRNARSRSVTKP